MIQLKSPQEIKNMEDGGRMLGSILVKLLKMATPGVALNYLEKIACQEIEKVGGSPSFKTVKGYSWATCLCVNDIVVHGIPSGYILKQDDLLTIDIGMIYKGLHTDTAWSKIVGERDKSTDNPSIYDKKVHFLKAGEETIWKAIDVAIVGNRIGHISQVIDKSIHGAGYSVIGSLVGHGVGRSLHEAPLIPGILKVPIESTPLLEEGMGLAIEVIYASGKGAIIYDNDDGWTLATRDGSWSAVFEHSIAITASGPKVLTKC